MLNFFRNVHRTCIVKPVVLACLTACFYSTRNKRLNLFFLPNSLGMIGIGGLIHRIHRVIDNTSLSLYRKPRLPIVIARLRIGSLPVGGPRCRRFFVNPSLFKTEKNIETVRRSLPSTCPGYTDLYRTYF